MNEYKHVGREDFAIHLRTELSLADRHGPLLAGGSALSDAIYSIEVCYISSIEDGAVVD